MSWLLPRRAREAFADSVAASGAGGYGSIDPIDGDAGYVRVGAPRRSVPDDTLEKARTLSVHAYRTNPMARAILDTYTSFCVGDSGLTLQPGPDDRVREAAEGFWVDPVNNLAGNAELLLRSHMLMGETALEAMVGPTSGVVRIAPIDTTSVRSVGLAGGNPLAPSSLTLRMADGSARSLDVVRFDDVAQTRTGEVLWWPEWRTLVTDRRGYPFLAPILDWLGAYDQVLWNLVDRTALARYLVWDVTVTGNQSDVDSFIKARNGIHAPKSGTMEVHNDKVRFDPKTAPSGASEDSTTAQQALTNIAAGTGLAKTWLAEPEDANRATSLTMAEPVRRRVGGVQNMWLARVTELVRFAVDQRVRAGLVPAEVEVPAGAGVMKRVRASETVTVTGPEIAAADAKVNAEILTNLSTGLAGMVAAGVLAPEAARMAARKAWEDYLGVPYDPKLDVGDPEKLADYLDDQATPDELTVARQLGVVG